MARDDQPKWSKQSTERVESISAEFDENIRRIAIRIARHEKSVYVDPRHVDEAKGCLSRSGLNRRPWYERPELEVGLGMWLLGLMFAIPDIVGIITSIPEAKKPYVSWSVIAVFAALGAFFSTHGWYRGRC